MEPHEQQTIEQNLHALHVQKHALQQQLMESELALKELSGAKQAYKIVGTLMLAADSETLKAELERKHESAKTRLAMLESQEAKLHQKLGHGQHH